MKTSFTWETKAIVCSIVAACACSAEGNMDSADAVEGTQTEDTSATVTGFSPVTTLAEQRTALAEEELLAEVTIGSETFRFSRYVSEGQGTFVLELSGPANMPIGLLHRLYEQYPDLTLLETLLALSPTAIDGVPQSLREFHLQETQTQGRADASVRSVEFDREPVAVDKQQSQLCDNVNQNLTALGETWQANRLNRADVVGGVAWDGQRLCPVFQGFPGCDHQSFGGTHLLNICNVGDSLHAWASTQTNSGPWVFGPRVVVPAFSTKTWRILPTSTGFFTDMKVAGLTIVTPFDGGTFYARAGYASRP